MSAPEISEAPKVAEHGPYHPFTDEEQAKFPASVAIIPNALSTGDIILGSGDPVFWGTLKAIFGPLLIILVLPSDVTDEALATCAERLRGDPMTVPPFATVFYVDAPPALTDLFESVGDGIVEAFRPTQAAVLKLRDHDADDKELVIEGQRVSIVARALEATADERPDNDAH